MKLETMLAPALVLSVLLAAAPPPPGKEKGERDVTLAQQVGVETQAEPAERPKERGVEGLAIPLVSYTSDLGFGYGAVGGMYIYAPGYAPYRHAIGAQAFITSRGVHNHFLRYDGPRLLGGARVEGRLEYRRELLSPFYGAGNLSAPDFTGDMSDERFNYERLSPGIWTRVRFSPLGEEHPLEPWVGYHYRLVQVSSYEGSILAEQRPVGIEGGSNGQLLAGVLWDTRSDEVNPATGGLEEVALRLAATPTGSRFQFGGVTLVERRFFSFSPRLVVAQRLTLDYLFGDVPFFELANIGGSTGAEGLGGMSSVRGVPRNRFVGNVKLLSNTELRYRAFDFRFLGQNLTAGGLLFFDVGRVWHPTEDDGGLGAWHPGVGAGLRVARRAAVLRLDYALSTETLRQGLYISVGQMF
jgi:hypothetical protein